MASKSSKKVAPVTFIPAPAGVKDSPIDPETTGKPGNKLYKFWHEQIRPFLIMVLILFCMRSSLADWNVVPTGSMKPTIIEGDRIFVNKLAYDLKVPFTHMHIAEWGNPKRGEIVVFDSPADGTRLVKRVLGLPGDVIELRDNVLSINGKKADYTPLDLDTINQVQPGNREKFYYFNETIDGITHPVRFKKPESFLPGEMSVRNFSAVTVPPNCYFMLGDNRDESRDSRFDKTDRRNPGPGFVPRDRIVGRSGAVVLSLDYDDYYLPRKSRFFRKLP